jgi:hypothetical protein
MSRSLAPVAGLIGLLLLLPSGLYVGGYLLMPDTFADESHVWRTYGSKWQWRLFKPMEPIEEIITGKDVHVGYRPSLDESREIERQLSL